MKLLPSLLLAAAPALTLGTILQEGTPQDGETPPPEATDDDSALPERGGQGIGQVDIFGRPTRTRRNTLAEKLIGGWRLTRMDLAGTSSVGRIAQGFMNVSDSFLSMEIHAAYNDDASIDAPPNDVHAAFTAEYRIAEGGVMECITVIGSFLDDDTGELRWERSGFRRRYKIEHEAGLLILTYGQEFGELTRLYFQPQLPSISGDRDIFGRKKGTGTFGGERDIFGRPVSAGSGERDVFGREKPAEGSKKKGEGDGKGGSTGGRVPPAPTGRGGSR